MNVPPRPIRLSTHARGQCIERGASELEVKIAIEKGLREPAKRERRLYRYNFPFQALWNG